MHSVIREVKPLDHLTLRLYFNNGSTATVNMEKACASSRFACLKDRDVFRTVSTDGSQVIWSANGDVLTASVDELLDSLMEDTKE